MSPVKTSQSSGAASLISIMISERVTVDIPEELLRTPSTIHRASEHDKSDANSSASMTNDALLPGLLASSNKEDER